MAKITYRISLYPVYTFPSKYWAAYWFFTAERDRRILGESTFFIADMRSVVRGGQDICHHLRSGTMAFIFTTHVSFGGGLSLCGTGSAWHIYFFTDKRAARVSDTGP